MFNNPLNRKYQTGGPAPTDDERKDMEGFITWIKSNIEGFKDKSTKEIAQSISDMAKSDEGKKSVQELYSKYQKSKKQKSKFADGGKMQSFICKHAHGGDIDCGCKGMVVRGDQGIPQVPSKVVIVPKPIKGGKRLDGITGIRSETTRGNNIVQTLSKEMPNGTTSYTELEITPDRDSTFRSWNTRYGENDNVNRYVTPTVYKQLPWYKKLSPVVNMAPQHWIEAFKNNFVESDQNGGSVKSTNLNQFAKQSLDKILEQTARYNKFKNVLGKLVPTNQNSSINSPSFPMAINDINKYVQDINKRKERINKITNYFGIWKKEQPGIPINNSGNLPMPPAAPAEYGIRMPWWSEQFIRDYWSRPEYYENLREENNSPNPRRNLLEEVNEIYAGTPDYASDLQRHQEGGPILTRRQARELSGLNRGYSRSNFQTAMANADLALRNAGLRGKELRQAKRRMVAGINVEPTPEVALTDNTVPTVVTQPIQEAVALSELPVRTPVIEKPVRPVVRRKPIIKVEQPVVVETAPVDDGEWIFGTHPEYAPRPGRVQIPERRSWFVSALGDARDAKIGAIGAGQVRDLYAEGRDEEAKELAKNYTIANAVGIAGAAGTQAAVEGLPYIKAAAEKAAAIKRIPSIEEADVLRRAWNNGAGYVPISGFKCGGQVENAQRGGRISHALNWLVSGLQDARDSRIGAVGAGPVRELYNEGRDTEASNYAQNYALANLGGALGAVGANSAIGYTAASNMVNPGSVLLGEEMASGAAPGVMIGVSGPIMDEVDNKKKNKK